MDVHDIGEALEAGNHGVDMFGVGGIEADLHDGGVVRVGAGADGLDKVLTSLKSLPMSSSRPIRSTSSTLMSVEYRGSVGRLPIHFDQALRFGLLIMSDIRTAVPVQGDAFAARHIARHFIAGNGLAAFGADDGDVFQIPADLQLAGVGSFALERAGIIMRRFLDQRAQAGHDRADGGIAVADSRQQVFLAYAYSFASAILVRTSG